MLDTFYARNSEQIATGDTPTTYHRFELDQFKSELLDRRIQLDKIFEAAQELHGPISTNISTFDNWIRNLLPVQFKYKKITHKGRVYFFDNVKYRKPRHPSNPDVFLFPHQARREMLTYYSVVTASVVSYDVADEGPAGSAPEPSKVTTAEEGVEIAKIPVMLGSILCNLRGYSRNDLRRVYEDASDPFGYFVVKGGERVILLQENLIPMKRFSVMKKATKPEDMQMTSASQNNHGSNIKSSFTTQDVVGSTVISVTTEKARPVLNVLFSQRGHKGATTAAKEYPVIAVLDIMLQLISKETYGYDLYDTYNIRNKDDEDTHDERTAYNKDAKVKRERIVDYIFKTVVRYCRPENEETVLNYLRASVQFYYAVPSPRDKFVDVMDIYNHSTPIPKKGIKPAPPVQYMVDERMTDEGDTRHHFDQISSLIADAFSLVPLAGKPDSMLRLVSQHIQTSVGLRQVDDRDSWGNKRIKFAYENLAQVVNGNFKIEINDKKQPGGTTLIAHVKPMFDVFVKSFGAEGFNERKDAVETLRRNNQVLPFSTIARINPGTKRQTKQLNIRMVQSSQLGVICPFETPTGGMCGLSKNMSVTTSISIRRDATKYRGEVLEKVLVDAGYPASDGGRSYSAEEGRVHSVVLNGEVVAWCGNEIEKPLRSATKSNIDFFDVGIFAMPEDMTIEIYTVGGRALRPLLTTTHDKKASKNHLVINRVISKIVPTSKTIVMDLVKLGAIEFVHIEEQNRATIAENLERVQEIYRARKFTTVAKSSPAPAPAVCKRSRQKEAPVEDEDEDDYDEEDEFAEDGAAASAPPPPPDSPKASAVVNRVGWYKGREFPVYCEINPVAVFGVAAGNMPYQNTCQGPRVTYQANMANQAQGNHHDFSYARFDSTAKRMDTGRGFLETQISGPIGTRRAPHGRMMMVAIIALANNGEDGIVSHQEAFENMKNIKTVAHRVLLKDIGGDGSKVDVFRDFLAPPSEKLVLDRHSKEGRNIFHAIGMDGLPRIGADIKRGDCIVSRKKDIRSQVDDSKELVDMSLYAGIGEDGTVERVETVRIRTDGKDVGKIVRVKLRKNRPSRTGDKIASRYSQKGTIGGQRSSTGYVTMKTKIDDPLMEEDGGAGAGGGVSDVFANSHFARSIPIVSSGPFAGMIPDVIINPHGQPSRMTAGMMMEMLASKAALFTGERIDGTAYRQPTRAKINEWRKILEDNGCDPDGFEEMVHPDNTKLKVKIFIGPCYYQGLHLVSDKIQFRNRGRVVHLTGQPVNGRANGGGLRNGEMEKSAMCSWGATSLLLDRLKNSSDRFPLEVCRTCGNQAIVSYSHNNIRMCRVCGPANQDIGIINTTYISILINRILLAMGIHATYSNLRRVEAGELDE